MFSQAKIRIKESARRARNASGGSLNPWSSGSSAANQLQQVASRGGTLAESDQENQMENNSANHKMANGKGPSSGGGGEGGWRVRRTNVVRNIDAFYEDHYANDMMDLGDMDDYPMDSSGGHGMDFDEMLMMSGAGGPSHHSMLSHFGRARGMDRHEKASDKIVHTDFFNKFDDLLDQDDLA